MEVASSSLVTRSKQIRNARSVPYFIRYRGQVVRQRSAKPSFASSNLAGTSKQKGHPLGCPFCLEVPARFERSNADVRWTSARTRLDGFDTMIFFPLGRKCNKSGRYPDALDAASKVLRRHKNRQPSTEVCRFLLITSLLYALIELGNS